MIDNKKEQEREELHRTIWNMANDLRGSVDGWDFKQYVLGMLFYRYISENFVRYVNAGEAEAGNANFDYASLSDSDAECIYYAFIIMACHKWRGCYCMFSRDNVSRWCRKEDSKIFD